MTGLMQHDKDGQGFEDQGQDFDHKAATTL